MAPFLSIKSKRWPSRFASMLGHIQEKEREGRHALTDSPPWSLTAEPYICSCITWNMGSFFQTTGNGQLTYFFVILHPEPYSPSDYETEIVFINSIFDSNGNYNQCVGTESAGRED